MQPFPSQLPDSDAIRRLADDIVRRPDYQLEGGTRDNSAILRLLWRLLEWLAAPFRWLFEAMEGLPDALRWVVVIGLFLLLAALVVHIGYTIVAAVKGPKRHLRFAAEAGGGGALDADTFERQSQRAMLQQDFISAVRLLFRACLVRLEQIESKRSRPGTTNREHLRRYCNSAIFEPMNVFVETIDSKWYGAGRCEQADFQACQEAYARIRALIRGVANAHGA